MMKFLKRLLGRNTDVAPTWDVTPADQRPPPRRRRAAAVAELKTSVGKTWGNPFLDEAMQKFELESDGNNAENPYDSYSWTLGPENDSRKMEKTQFGKRIDKQSEDHFNPYDTGVFKRGWK